MVSGESKNVGQHIVVYKYHTIVMDLFLLLCL